jgi:hypothetical protein
MTLFNDTLSPILNRGGDNNEKENLWNMRPLPISGYYPGI